MRMPRLPNLGCLGAVFGLLLFPVWVPVALMGAATVLTGMAVYATMRLTVAVVVSLKR